MTAAWHPLIAEAEFPTDGKYSAKVAGWHVLVAKTEAGLYAVNDRCTHQAAMLSGGRVRRGAIMCPLHGARFELATGKCIGATYTNLRRFDVRITDGMVEIEVPVAAPGIDEIPIAS